MNKLIISRDNLALEIFDSHFDKLNLGECAVVNSAFYKQDVCIACARPSNELTISSSGDQLCPTCAIKEQFRNPEERCDNCDAVTEATEDGFYCADCGRWNEEEF